MRRSQFPFSVPRRIAAIAISLIPVVGCFDSYGPGSNDFSYNVSGGYQVFRSSAHEVRIVPKKMGSNDPQIPSEVVEIAWDDSFILARQQDSGRSNYWILDLKGSALLGPLTEAEFQAARSERSVDQRLKLQSVYELRPR